MDTLVDKDSGHNALIKIESSHFAIDRGALQFQWPKSAIS